MADAFCEMLSPYLHNLSAQGSSSFLSRWRLAAIAALEKDEIKQAWRYLLPKETKVYPRHALPKVYLDGELAAGVMALDHDRAEKRFGHLVEKEARELLASKNPEPLSLFHLAAMSDFYLYYFPSDSESRARLIFPELIAGAYFPRFDFHLSQGSKLVLEIELPKAPLEGAFFHQMLSFSLEEGAHLTLYIYGEQKELVFVDQLFAKLKKGAVMEVMRFTKGEKQSFFYAEASLLGEQSSFSIQGLSQLEGKEQLHQRVIARHKAPSARSSQHFRSLLSGRARNSFCGEIHVDQIAQKTESYQQSRFLLLEKGAAAFTEPRLEIYADDVKASHGATISELEEGEPLLYLMARGLSKQIARSLLKEAFIRSSIEGLPSHLKELALGWYAPQERFV